MDPVLQDMELRSRRERHMYISMIMAENKVIDIVGCNEVNGKLIQRFILSPEHIFLVMGKTVVPGPSVSKTESQPRMEKTEKELRHAAVEDSSKKAVAERNRAQAVSMAKTEPLSTDFDQSRLGKLDHSQFLKV